VTHRKKGGMWGDELEVKRVRSGRLVSFFHEAMVECERKTSVDVTVGHGDSRRRDGKAAFDRHRVIKISTYNSMSVCVCACVCVCV